MQIFNQILNGVNQAVIWVVSIAFTVQIIYLFLFFLPAKKYPKAQNKHKFAIVICAHNEQDVIALSLRYLNHMRYPKHLYRVFVIADNCTDATAEIAAKMGATVIERVEEDPKKRNVGYALQYALPKILELYPEAEAFIRFDADNVVHPDYIDKMNDAFDAGYGLARGYNHAYNLSQNIVSGVSGLWYIRDCRFNCQAKSALGIGQMLVGGGMMFSADIIREYGWQQVTASEDAEFTIDMLLKKQKAVYVKDAIVYEDQPTTIMALFKRNCRMGNALTRLFFTHGIKCFGKFFTCFRYSLLDMFLTMLFMPIAVLCVAWFPAYYIYLTAYHFAVGGSFAMTGACANCGFFVNFLGMDFNALAFIGWILLLAFVVPFILQAVLVYILDYKRVGEPFYKLLPAILCFPLFMIIYALGIALGAVSKPKWKQSKRSTCYDKAFIATMERETEMPFITDVEQLIAEAQTLNMEITEA